MKVLVAMSGGVDSSVAAARLLEAGHEVTGVHLKLSDAAVTADAGGRTHGCCSVADADDARRVAQILGIPFYVWNLTSPFHSGVVDDFVQEYARGRTPNPCVRCNERVKFGTLLERAEALGFDALATGHYARVEHDGARYRLRRAVDEAKDQSYVLARLDQRALSRSLFPVGEWTKQETREQARRFGLRVADKPDSYDICFVPDGDTGSFLERSIDPRPGEVVDPDGRVLAEHDGVHRFTVGQRKGLGLATHERRYVLAVDAERARVVVGPSELLRRGGLEAEEVRWCANEPPAAIGHVQVRAHGTPIPARLEEASGERAVVRFARPERAIAPGQLVAFYDGDEVLGGGTIAAALP